ncbi:MAG: serine/threonine-protein kinase [Acidobacteriota bacterium]
MTDATRWTQVENLFHQLADQPAGAARDALATELCAHDPSLLVELRSLLAEDESLRADAPPADPHLGLSLGHYQIDRLIARGGMAAVYDAHRADDQFRQRVAVKIMDLRVSDPALVAQFRAERQILARLEHPALTRLLDGGVTAFGEPYLVMEFVDGQPIDGYCDAQQLDLRGRLRLFAEVCEGVAFAHRNLVLHRDLKPSNVLVTSDGHAKVVDFGTATLLEPDRLSTVSRAPLTPAFASPEQLTGQAVGTASDQYSLGLMLYELLTGAAPFSGRTSMMAAVERALARTETTAPHAVVTEAAARTRQTSLARLQRVLSGDLATILGKALAHDPAARYASVQHLADDLTRWGHGEPILGRAPSLTYRATRFVQRHAVAVAVAAALALALVAATIVSFEQATMARRQAAIAQAESAKARTESGKARQLNRFLTQMLSSANPSWYNANAGQAGSITVRQVLDGAGALIPTELKDAPEVEAEMQRTLGRTYIGLGAFPAARPHLHRALSLYEAQGDAFGVAFTKELLGEAAFQTGDFKGGEVLLRDAVAYVRSRGADADPELHLIATNDLAVAIQYQRPGDAEAIALVQESIDVADRNHLNPSGTSVVVANLAGLLIQAGRLDDAGAAANDARRRMDALPVPPPERVAVAYHLSTIARLRGNYVEAERLAGQAVETMAVVWPEGHPLQPAIQTNWGRTLVDVGQLEHGRAILLDSYAAFKKARPAGHADLARPLIGLGSAYRQLGNLQESARVLREARDLVQKNSDLKERAADISGELGLTLRVMKRASEASALLKESHDTYLAIFGEGHPSTVRALARLSTDPPFARQRGSLLP